MPIATFLELCMDTDGDDSLGRFWAETIGSEFRPDPGGLGNIVGEYEYQSIAMCKVPEPTTVKHRIHLDVYAASIDELVARGASVLQPAEESGFRWTVMADPEGGEFDVFLRDDPPDFKLHGIVVDCVDPEATAAWWGEIFGVDPRLHDEGPWWELERVTPDAVLTLDFVPVPEPKTVKNRIHWDVRGRLKPSRPTAPPGCGNSHVG